MTNKWKVKKALNIKEYDFNRITKKIEGCVLEAFGQIQNITKYEDNLEDLVGYDNLPDNLGKLKYDMMNFLQEKLGQYGNIFKELKTKLNNRNQGE